MSISKAHCQMDGSKRNFPLDLNDLTWPELQMNWHTFTDILRNQMSHHPVITPITFLMGCIILAKVTCHYFVPAHSMGRDCYCPIKWKM